MAKAASKKRSTGKANKHTRCGRRCSKNAGRSWPLLPDGITLEQALVWLRRYSR
jgi:hypothetical protein